MKALSFIGLILAAFLVFLGISSRNTAGSVLGNAVTIGGIIIAAFVIIVWIILFIKEKRNSDKDSDF
ncbi:MAG TPA: hypothetical protein VIL74_21840 [Pyrinomonadaceae bacterium]|jgi:hypothetical protein